MPFEIDHIIPRKHSGATVEGYLALACFYCNRYKGANIAGIDPPTGQVHPLFHPRIIGTSAFNGIQRAYKESPPSVVQQLKCVG
jgi:hypothetical protein